MPFTQFFHILSGKKCLIYACKSKYKMKFHIIQVQLENIQIIAA